MAELKLYHATLDAKLESIARDGICLNREKANRELKSFTDLFNHVFNQTYEKYLPERVKVTDPIDRNESIFLSAFQGEFRKSEHPMVEGKQVEGKDIVYECVFDHDLPAFDAGIYENYVNILKRLLGFSPLVSDYFAQSEANEKSLFSNLIKYFISGDFEILNMPGDKREGFEELRQKVLESAESAVKLYCEHAVNASDVVSRYSHYEKDRTYSWMLDEGVEEDLPKIIIKLEILCNRYIKDFSLVEYDGIQIYREGIPEERKDQFEKVKTYHVRQGARGTRRGEDRIIDPDPENIKLSRIRDARAEAESDKLKNKTLEMAITQLVEKAKEDKDLGIVAVANPRIVSDIPKVRREGHYDQVIQAALTIEVEADGYKRI